MFSRSISVFVLGFWASQLVGCAEMAMSEEDGAERQNSCSSDAACPSGTCSDGLCVATSNMVETVLLEVTPPTGASDAAGNSIAGVRFTQLLKELVFNGEPRNLELGFVGKVEGTVQAPASTANCVPVPETEVPPPASDDGSLPARISLIPRERLLGLPTPVVTTLTQLVDGKYQFALDVPPGKFDVYVEPTSGDRGCVRAPYLVVDQGIPPERVDLTVTLPEPNTLAVAVRWPLASDDLAGWTIDIVERSAGRLLSNRVVLAQPASVGDGLEYGAELAFSPVSGDSVLEVDEIVRLSPPENVVAPTIFVQRSVVELFQGGEGLIDQLTELSAPVQVAGQVSRQGTPKAAPATVSLVATALSDVSPGTVAAFSRTVTTAEDGSFDVELLPGEYAVVVVPAEAGLGATQQKLTVSGNQSSQKGLVFEVPAQHHLAGSVLDFRGAALGDVLVEATSRPSSTLGSSIVELANASGAFQPRAASASSLGSGEFVLLADSGTYDVVARPQEATGLPWGLHLGVQLDESRDLEPLQLSLPRVLEGRVTSKDVGQVPSALIRAHFFVRDNEPTSKVEEADRLVPVAEARVDADGKYRLLLPSTFR